MFASKATLSRPAGLGKVPTMIGLALTRDLVIISVSVKTRFQYRLRQNTTLVKSLPHFSTVSESLHALCYFQ